MGPLAIPAVATALRCAGPVFYMGMQASSARTAMTIAHDNSVGDLSPIPFLSLFTSALIGSMYGILKGETTLIVPNVTGFVVGAGCVTSYYRNQVERDYKTYGTFALVGLVSIALALLKRNNALGAMGCVLATLLLASPLATVKTVIKNKNTNSLPFWTSFITWINALSWSLFGLFMMNDPWIYAPNMLGLFFATIQLALFVLFGMPNRSSERLPNPKQIF